ncbi:MAG: HD-GYP domain-containing protein [Gemmatimonadales bacterium]
MRTATPGLHTWESLSTAEDRILVLADSAGRSEWLTRLLQDSRPERVLAIGESDLGPTLQAQPAAAVVLMVPDPVPRVQRIHELDPQVGILLLADTLEGGRVAELFRAGVSDLLTGAVTPDRLRDCLSTMLERRRERIRTELYSAWLRSMLGELRAEVERESERVVQHSLAALEVLTQTLEAKDSHMAGHSLRVAEIAGSIATAMRRSEWDVERIRVAGRLHDIGMIAVPQGLLSRAGPLSQTEYAIVREHVTVATKILSPFASLQDVIGFIRGHHERWDGAGYPDGLGGEAIPWGARVLAAAEIFDALATSRPYQRALPPEACLERMASMSGTALDPAVYQALATVVQSRKLLPFLHHPEAAGRGSVESWAVTEITEFGDRETNFGGHLR